MPCLCTGMASLQTASSEELLAELARRAVRDAAAAAAERRMHQPPTSMEVMEDIPPPQIPQIFKTCVVPDTESTAAPTSVRSNSTKVPMSTAASRCNMTSQELLEETMETMRKKKKPTTTTVDDQSLDSDNSIDADKLGASTSTSKKSKARGSTDRGPKRKARDERKLVAYLASQGKHFDKDAGQKAVEVATGVRGTMALEVQRFLKESLDAARAKLTDEELHEWTASLVAEPKAICTEVKAEILKQGLEKKALEMSLAKNSNGDLICRLCGKHAADAHLSSHRHQYMVSFSAGLTYLAGEPFFFRPNFQGIFPGGGKPLTQELARAFWGDSLDWMPNRCRQIYKGTNIAAVKLSNPKSSYTLEKHWVRPSQLLMVPYVAGQGQYIKAGRPVKAVRWSCMPMGSEIDRGMTPHMHSSDLDELSNLRSDNSCQDTDQGVGFWPVVQWEATEAAPEWVVELLTTCCYVSCIVQWLEAWCGAAIVAWLLHTADLD